MVKWYLLQIKLKRITLEDIPTKWHDAVEKALEEETKKALNNNEAS